MRHKTIAFLILLSISIIACKNEVKTTLKGEDIATALTLVSNESVDLKLTKIYNIGMLNQQEVEISLNQNKNFTIVEELDKLLLCFAVADNGAVPFYIGSDMERNIQVVKNNEGNLEFKFDTEDHINIFTKTFHKKLEAIFAIKGDENDFLNAVDKAELELLNQLDEIKPKIDHPSYSTLLAMVSGKMAHFKFLVSDRFEPLNSQSSYYDFTDNLNFDNDYYLIYSDNLNTLHNSVEIQYERKYNSSFADASNKLEFINEYIKNNEIKSQYTCLLLSKEIPKKTEQEKQVLLAKIKKTKIKDVYYQHIASMEAGIALGAKIGNQIKYLETLISKNKDFDIENLEKKTLYIDNWATWCGPCLKSMASFRKKHEELSKIKDVIFVFVSFDRNESIWRDYLKKINFPQKNVVHLYNGTNMKSSYSKYYNILELPHYLLVNKSGFINDLNPSTPSDKDFQQFIKETSTLDL